MTQLLAYMLVALILGGGILSLLSVDALRPGPRSAVIPSAILRESPQRRYLTLMLLSVSLWSLSYGLELLIWHEAPSIWLHRVAYIGIASTPPLVLMVAIEATHRAAPLYRAIAFTGLGGAAVTAMLSMFGSAVWSPSGTVSWYGLTPVLVRHGPWFPAHVALSYICIAAAATLLISRLRPATALVRRDVGATLAAMSLPWASNAAHLFLGLGGPVDPTPVAFAGTAAFLVWLVRHDDLPRVVRASKRFALECHPEPYVLARRDGRILDANVAGRELLEALGASNLAELPSVLALLSDQPAGASEVSLRLADGARQLEIHIFDVPPLSDSLRGLVFRDVTTQRRTEQSLVDQAHFDSLTGLPNRRLFYKQLGVSLAMAKAKQGSAALVLFDLDRFKETNDTLGHDAGDALLKQVAATTQAAVRTRDVVGRLDANPLAQSVARLGGDEFVVILSDISKPEDAADVAERILRALNTPLSILDSQTTPSASMGVAVFPQDGEDADSLFRAADQALYYAKERGRNQCQLFHPALNRTAQRRRMIRSELRTALRTGQLALVYQPKIDLRLDRVCGAEALLRWRHPSLGQIPPNEFVSVAESSGLAAELGRYVFDRVCKDITHFGWSPAPGDAIAVNVCPVELTHPDYFMNLTDKLREYGVRPEFVQLEITERTLIDESPTTAINLRDIRGIGITVYLDDFGTGQSSLSDLLKHKVDGIKLDRTFVSEMVSDRVAAGVIRAILKLAAELGLGVVAEGVESSPEAALLRDLGCAQAQGFFWAKGVSAKEFFTSCADDESDPFRLDDLESPPD